MINLLHNLTRHPLLGVAVVLYMAVALWEHVAKIQRWKG